MTAPLSTFVGVQFIVDPDGSTPPALVKYDQVIFWLPPEYVTWGTGPANTGVIGSGAEAVRGYHQLGGPTGHQWVMTSLVTSVLRDQFNAIPGPSGWKVAASRTAYRTIAQQLLDVPYSMAGPDVVTLLTNAYNAAATNARV